VVTLLHQVGITIGVVSHLLDYDVKNEFDPLMIERIKTCMKQLIDKQFIYNLKNEIQLQSTLMSAEAKQMCQNNEVAPDTKMS
jgi:hypothetical protein